MTGGAHGEGTPNIEANILLGDSQSNHSTPIDKAIENFDLWWADARDLTSKMLADYAKRHKLHRPKGGGGKPRTRPPKQKILRLS